VSASAPDAKALLINHLKADASVLEYLVEAGDTNEKQWSIHPNVHQTFDSNTPAPFIYIGGGGIILSADDVVESLEFWIGVYDDPEKGYWLVDEIHRRLYDSLENLQLVNAAAVAPLVPKETLQGVLDPLRRLFISDETQDQELNKLLKFARYRTWLVG